jgi:Secretion system C-terminal sorting domain/Chaperone of endosialidase
LLRQLRPVTYLYNSTEHKALNLPTTKQHGLIAQEVQSILPELVKTTRYTIPGEKSGKNLSEEFLAVNYQGLIPILIKAIQEQQTEIDALKTALGQQSNLSAENPGKTISTNTGDFKASQFTLLQNTPNPFSSSTTIRYSLPKGVSNATIAVFDLNGKMQLQYNNLNGSSQITINGNTLQPGMYIYTLLAEGQEVVSKRMILTK